MTWILPGLIALLLPPNVGWAWAYCMAVTGPARRVLVSHVLLGWIFGGIGTTLGGLTTGVPQVAACGLASIAVAAVIWWWRRRKRKRALRELGDKSRRRLAAILSSLRERAQPRPRPGLQPVPQGAR